MRQDSVDPNPKIEYIWACYITDFVPERIIPDLILTVLNPPSPFLAILYSWNNSISFIYFIYFPLCPQQNSFWLVLESHVTPCRYLDMYVIFTGITPSNTPLDLFLIFLQVLLNIRVYLKHVFNEHDL